MGTADMSIVQDRKPKRGLLFDEDFLKKLEYLYIVSKKVFTGETRAERRGKKIGSGIEFADHRDYVPGDDFRYIDWNLYGRMEKLLLRLFEEEEDLSIYLLLDASGSMTTGESVKFDYARRVVAALGYVALANLDRASIVPFADSLGTPLTPKRGKGQIFRVLEFLESVDAGGRTDMEASFRTFVHRTRRRGLAVVVSDFFDPKGYGPALKMLRHRRFETFILQVCDPSEAHPPLKGELRLRDTETAEERVVAVSPEVLRAYEREFEEYCERLEDFCVSIQAGFIRTLTSRPFEELVLNVFRKGKFLE
jgi:uncharacterized protein (DUF58 family)